MLGDTLTLPHSGGDVVLVKVNQDGYSSEYLFKDATHQYIAKVRHSRTKATTARPSYDRHNVEVVETIYATEGVDEYTRKCYIVLEQLPADVDVEIADALADWLIATSDLVLDKLMGWES
jgi:hypothetical protein